VTTGASGSRADFYRGVDRRQRRGTAPRLIRRAHVSAAVATVAVLGVGLPTGLARMSQQSNALQVQGAVRNLWAVLFLCAGVLHIVRHRITGEARTGLRGVATLYFGAMIAVAGPIAPLLYQHTTEATLSPLTRAIAVLGCLLLLGRATRSAPVDTSTRPLRHFAVVLLVACGFIAIVMMLAQGGRTVDAADRTWFVIECGLTLLWLLCLLSNKRGAGTRPDASGAWMSVCLLLMAVAEALRAASFAAPGAVQFYSTGLQLAVGVIVLFNAAADAMAIVSADSSRMLLLSGAVHDAERQLGDDADVDQARRHDARSVLASLRAATLVLDRYDAELDQGSRAELLGSFGAELHRLERVIDDRVAVELQEFHLHNVVHAVVAETGAVDIPEALTPIAVRGRAAELTGLVSSVVQTLARRSTSGRVQLRVKRSTSGVQLVCHCACDPKEGPSADVASAANLRLKLAQRLMRAQGGDVVLHERWEGSVSVVFWLRPAVREIATDHRVEVVEPIDDADLVPVDQDPAPLSDLPRQEHHHGRPRHVIMSNDKVDRDATISRYEAKPT
jgi:hypothetical protein